MQPRDPWIIHARWKKFAPRSEACSPTEEDAGYVYVHMTIQLYQLEHDNYLVDFKCSGYERLLTKKKKRVGFEEQLGGDESGGRLKEEGGGRQKEESKEANSPFPFLDVAGMLIVALAEAGD